MKSNNFLLALTAVSARKQFLLAKIDNQLPTNICNENQNCRIDLLPDLRLSIFIFCKKKVIFILKNKEAINSIFY